MNIKEFFIKKTVFKKYLLISYVSLMLLVLLILFFSGILKVGFFILSILGYSLIYWILYNQPLPLFPPIHEESSEAVVGARYLIFWVYIFCIIGFVISQFFLKKAHSIAV